MIAVVRTFNATGLSVGTSGNASVRVGQNVLITPSAVPYEDLSPADLVELDMHGNVVSGNLAPSTEWHFHAAIYRARTDINAIVHVHSPYATALACTRKGIPAFHYMVAKAGGSCIECARYATFGTPELAENAVTALGDRKACLLANHGMLAVGTDPATALAMARDVEELARQYSYCLQAGDPVLLDEAEMQTNVEKFRHYSQPGHSES